GDKILFQKLEGVYAKVWRDGKDKDLGGDPWVLNIRAGVASEGVPDRGPAAAAAGTSPGTKPPFIEKPLPNDGAVITNGTKSIAFHPASKMTRERTEAGGFRICMQGGDDEFGVVEIGLETTLFLAKDQCVEFDANGNVINFNGVSHEYRPLMDAIYDADPIQDATDASPSFSKHH